MADDAKTVADHGPATGQARPEPALSIWVFLLLLATTLAFAWFLYTLGKPLQTLHAHHGMASFELSWFTNSTLEVAREWSVRRLTEWAQFTIYLDFVFIVLYVATLWGSCSLAGSYLGGELKNWSKQIRRAQLIAGLLDAIENTLLLLLLSKFTEQGISTWWVEIAMVASVVAAFKFAFIFAGLALTSVGVMGWALEYGVSRPRKSPAPDPVPNLPEQANLAQVLNAELNLICSKAHELPSGTPESQLEQVQRRAYEENLKGLAFSGGGIRSATFCLGILQALARHEKLKDFHYLSTVSGGGYIGSWLTAWISRTKGGLSSVEQTLRNERPNVKGRQPDPVEIDFLRTFSNYLTPRKGWFTVDTWTGIATYVRNLFLNLIILVGFGWALLSALLLVVFHDFEPKGAGFFAAWMLLLATFCMTLAMKFDINQVRNTPRVIDLLQSEGGILFTMVLPLVVFTVCGSVWCVAYLSGREVGDVTGFLQLAVLTIAVWGFAWFLANALSESTKKAWRRFFIAATVIVVVSAIFAWLATQDGKIRTAWIAEAVFLVTLVTVVGLIIGAWGGEKRRNQVWDGYVLFRFILGTLMGLLIFVWASYDAITFGLSWVQRLILGNFVHVKDPNDLLAVQGAINITVAPPVLLGCVGVGVVVALGIDGSLLRDKGREWWARIGAWAMIVMTAWVILGIAPLVVPGFFVWMRSTVGEQINFGIGGLWILATAAAVIFGRSGAAALKPSALSRFLIGLAPYLFAVGLIAIVTNLYFNVVVEANNFYALRLRDNVIGSQPAPLLMDIAYGIAALSLVQPSTFVMVGGASLYVALLFSFCVDINRFSFHDFYRNRLVRCYLGASNANRREEAGARIDVDPFTGFSDSDNPELATMANHAKPYHLINTALNLAQSNRLAWQERKAASFVFSPLYCGFHLAGLGDVDAVPSFRNTNRYADPRTPVTLGTAMAISGAAVSPNMGQNTTPAFAFLLTLLNLRLGVWMANPGASPAVLRISPPMAAAYLFLELLGKTDERRDYVYLSDGGHFENLGVYELVRRRCRTIVVVDAGADPKRSFEDLGNCIRKCKVDLGASITIGVSNVDLTPNGISAIAWADGEIEYADGSEGKLLYLKPSIYGASQDRAQLSSFFRIHPDFPHQPTTNQWFTESQFESYRALGELIGEQAIVAKLR